MTCRPNPDGIRKYVLAAPSASSHSSNNYFLQFKAMGAAYGTAKAGIGISGMGTVKPELIMKVRLTGPQLDTVY